VRPALHVRGSAEAIREDLYAASPAVIFAHAERLTSLVEGTSA
jgi:hypothetical protein